MTDRACTECIHHQLVRKRQGRKTEVTRHACTDEASIEALAKSKASARRAGVSCDDARRMSEATVCGPKGLRWAPKVSP